MPTGPKGEYRPNDTIECAVHIAKIATGEIEDIPQTTEKLAEKQESNSQQDAHRT